ncbi:MAG: response regulator [Bacteroidetes bacterium]|nr:response regulator [Bacteroidota bacterium]
MLQLFRNQSINDFRIPHNPDEIRKRIKIVVIDDDEASFPTNLLSTSGYTIEWWDKVDDRNLERLEKNHFDIIILDINDIAAPSISSTDGIGILERIKEVNPAQIVVAFSGQEFNIDKTHFFKKADDTLSKPVDFIKAKNLIDRIIDQKITLIYFWSSLNGYLMKEGVKTKQIKRVEKELISAIKNQRSVDYNLIGGKILKGVEISSKVIFLIKKFLSIVGFVAAA